MYSKELAHMIMEADKSQGLVGEPESQMSRRNDGIVLVQMLVDLKSGKLTFSSSLKVGNASVQRLVGGSLPLLWGVLFVLFRSSTD